MRQKLAELEKEKEDAAKAAAEKEALFQAEREKLEEDKSKWQGKKITTKIKGGLAIRNHKIWCGSLLVPFFTGFFVVPY